MNRILAELRAIWSAFRSSRWRYFAQIMVVGLSLVLMVRALTFNLSQIDATLYLDPGFLFFGLAFTLIAYWLGTLAWTQILRALIPDLPFLLAVKYHFVSTIAKYLPGCGWQQISKVVQLYRRGFPSTLATLPVILELMLTVLTELAVVALMLYSQAAIFDYDFSSEMMLAVVVALWVSCIAMPVVVQVIVRGKSLREERLLLHIWLAEAFDMAGSFALGVALWFIVRGLTPLSFDALPYCIVAVNVSFVAGLIVVFAPNGFGVRELTMSTLLQAVIPVPLAIFGAIIARIVLMVAEALGVVPIIAIDVLFRNLVKNDSKSYVDEKS